MKKVSDIALMCEKVRQLKSIKILRISTKKEEEQFTELDFNVLSSFFGLWNFKNLSN
jgi:hypothetical protein